MKTAQLYPRSLVASFIQRSATFERWLTSAARAVYTFERIDHGRRVAWNDAPLRGAAGGVVPWLGSVESVQGPQSSRGTLR